MRVDIYSVAMFIARASTVDLTHEFNMLELLTVMQKGHLSIL